MASRLFPIGVILITELSTANSLIVNMQRAVLFNMVLSTAVAVNPNVQKDYAELPAMGRASWDGIPSTTFIEKFFEPLCMALGSVSENANTLLSTAYTSDAGGVGPRANPHYNAASPQVRQQSQNRNFRLFACIMNYIIPTSFIYYMLMRDFRNDGIAVFRHIRAYGRLAYTSVETRRLENSWDDWNIRSAFGSNLTPVTLMKAAAEINFMTTKLPNKTPMDAKKKFLDALPHELQHLQSQHTQNVNHAGYAYPANYPAYYPANLALQPHPLAGQPDIHALALIIHEEWVTKLATKQIKSTPKGYVAMVNDKGQDVCVDVDTKEVVLSIDSAELTADSECTTCGGKWHYATQTHNGETVVCAAKAIGTASKFKDFNSNFNSRKSPKRDDRNKERYKSKERRSGRSSSSSYRKGTYKGKSKQNVSLVSQSDGETDHSTDATTDGTNTQSEAERIDGDSQSQCSGSSSSEDEVLAVAARTGNLRLRK